MESPSLTSSSTKDHENTTPAAVTSPEVAAGPGGCSSFHTLAMPPGGLFQAAVRLFLKCLGLERETTPPHVAGCRQAPHSRENEREEEEKDRSSSQQKGGGGGKTEGDHGGASPDPQPTTEAAGDDGKTDAAGDPAPSTAAQDDPPATTVGLSRVPARPSIGSGSGAQHN
ncbi:hypothetical protein SAY87_000110 [Trapa incisa]|uniref:Uncharacterized protein n=1 Tax=Trapa incisa TaxID=236973 RepID=A0AAN7GR55_9MYRT|nr:hypothetical protein SAY87_000110 [Trapa incisa]